MNTAPSPHRELEHLVFVDSDAVTARCAKAFSDRFHIAVVGTAQAACGLIAQRTPAAVVTDLLLRDGSGADVCRVAKALARPATVLVTTEDPQLVPNAIDAGCDGVLLKPFAPNLLFARLGRLLRMRADGLRVQDARRLWNLSGRGAAWRATTHEYWADSECPECQHRGVTSFEFASHRRAWYACPACHAVWQGRRRE